MSSRIGLLLGVVVPAVVVVAWAAPAMAQGQAQALPPSPAEVRVLPRADFHLSTEKLVGPDRRFRWLLELGFDMDVVDYRVGRLRLRGDYEAVEGRERRHFDLNQGTYFFELSGSRVVGDVEIVAMAQHVSRHLVDRDNPPAISWNEIGARLRYTGLWPFAAEIEVGRPWDQAFVDYELDSVLRLTWEHPIGGRATIYGSGTGRMVKGTAEDRQKGSGGRLEAGVRVRADAADIDVLAAYERRIDAWPTTRGRVRWVTIGIRVRSR